MVQTIPRLHPKQRTIFLYAPLLHHHDRDFEMMKLRNFFQQGIIKASKKKILAAQYVRLILSGGFEYFFTPTYKSDPFD